MADMVIMRGIIMGIKEWLFGEGDAFVSSEQQVIGKSEERKEPEITFESDKELLERKRDVMIGDEVIGCINKNSHDGLYEFKHTRMYLSMKAMIAITEKLKELNGCSALNNKYAKQQVEAFNRMCK